MKTVFHLLRAGISLALSLSFARAEFSWTNQNNGYTQGLTIRYERWIVNDLDSEPLGLAETSAGYATLEFGESIAETDWTETYDGRFGEFEAGVHYLVIPVLESVDEWGSEFIWVWVEGYWVETWEDGVLVGEYWVDGYWEQVLR